MPVTDVTSDATARTLTFTARYAAPVDRVWQVWADPRQLERWWGPPGYPATFDRHELEPGGSVTYSMTGPDGAAYPGYWRVASVRPPHELEFDDGFADESGAANQDLPVTRTRVSLLPLPEGGTEMRIVATFPSDEAMQQLVAMGMQEGMTQALGQVDALLPAPAEAGRAPSGSGAH